MSSNNSLIYDHHKRRTPRRDVGVYRRLIKQGDMVELAITVAVSYGREMQAWLREPACRGTSGKTVAPVQRAFQR